jgi:hypothetical protein
MARDKPAPKRLTVAQLLTRRLSTVALWYVTLALPFLLILAWVSVSEPAVAQFLVGDGSGPDLTTLMTPAEASHMEDVRVLVRDGMLLLLSAVIVLAVTWTVQPLERGQFRGALVMHAALLVLLIPFNWTFERFHAIAFPQGNWQFPADSYLISTFSGTFFAVAAFTWILLSIGMTYALYRTSA